MHGSTFLPTQTYSILTLEPKIEPETLAQRLFDECKGPNLASCFKGKWIFVEKNVLRWIKNELYRIKERIETEPEWIDPTSQDTSRWG